MNSLHNAWTEERTARGERCSNTHWRDRFTCPNCLTDHEVGGIEPGEFDKDRKVIRCECGAPLVLEVEMVPEAKCTIADEEDEEEIEDG